MPKSGMVTLPPSTSGRPWLIPTSPPQVRLPMTGPIPSSLK